MTQSYLHMSFLVSILSGESNDLQMHRFFFELPNSRVFFLKYCWKYQHSLYNISGTEAEANWRENNPNGYNLLKGKVTPGMTNVHRAAVSMDADRLKAALKEQPQNVNARDANGWMPIHVSEVVIV